MIPMLRNALHPVLVSLVAAVTDNLNSKHLGIYAAAVKALEASIAHLGKANLWHWLSSTAASPSRSQVNTESVDSCCRLWKYPAAARCLWSPACILSIPICCIMLWCAAEWMLLITWIMCLGSQKLWWCSPYAPVPRQAWMCTSISPKSQEPLTLCCLSALVQKELNNKSWSTTLLEFRDKGISGDCLGPIWLPKWIALLLVWRDTGPSELLQNSFLEGSTL